jgi:hypothetical protein
MPDKDTAFDVTGYVRGTITPLGSTHAWPVIADERITGTISIGGGEHGVGITVDADALTKALKATVADVTDYIDEQAALPRSETGLEARGGVEGFEDALHPAFHGALGYAQAAGDGLICQTGGGQREQLAVVGGQGAFAGRRGQRGCLLPEKVEEA